MNKRKSKPKSARVTKSQSPQRNAAVEEAITTTPAYRRAKTIAGIASTLGLAWIAIRATRNWWGNSDEDS